MPEHRMEARNQGYAKAILNGRPGYLRNLTLEGCKIVTVGALPHSIEEKITFQILPEETDGPDRITLTAQLRWEKKDGPYFVYGFLILGFANPQDESAYKNLVEIYDRS